MHDVMTQLMAEVLIVMERGERSFPVIGVVCGLDGVVHAQPAEGVINCTLPAHHVHTLREAPGVCYVRQIQSYMFDEQPMAYAIEDN